jgi:hypothetical protein
MILSTSILGKLVKLNHKNKQRLKIVKTDAGNAVICITTRHLHNEKIFSIQDLYDNCVLREVLLNWAFVSAKTRSGHYFL